MGSTPNGRLHRTVDSRPSDRVEGPTVRRTEVINPWDNTTMAHARARPSHVAVGLPHRIALRRGCNDEIVRTRLNPPCSGNTGS